MSQITYFPRNFVYLMREKAIRVADYSKIGAALSILLFPLVGPVLLYAHLGIAVKAYVGSGILSLTTATASHYFRNRLFSASPKITTPLLEHLREHPVNDQELKAFLNHYRETKVVDLVKQANQTYNLTAAQHLIEHMERNSFRNDKRSNILSFPCFYSEYEILKAEEVLGKLSFPS